MADLPANFADLRILLTNDDGIEADGLALLERLVRQFTRNVWVCAPAENQSAKSHSLTTRQDIILQEYDTQRFAVTGTPADSVVIGIQQIMRDHPPHFVLAGINAGRNLADDVVYSGTVAAAREASLLGFPAIAFSQQMADYPNQDWTAATAAFAKLFPALLEIPLPAERFLNVNFPARLQSDYQFELVRQGRYRVSEAVTRRKSAGTAFRLQTRTQTAAGEDTDMAAVTRGNIAVTPLTVDTTAYELLNPPRVA